MEPLHSEFHSIWQQIDKPFSPPLSFNVNVDVCVVGAGIAGLSTAYQLLREGKEVVVIDRERLGLNQTGLSSAHLSNALDEGFSKLRRLHGVEGMKLAAESHTRAIDEIEKIIAREGIECDFKRVDGYLFLAPNQNPDYLKEELEAAHEAGLKDVEMCPNAPIELFNTGMCLRYPRQAQFHPTKYLLGLANAIQKMGGKIFSHTAAVEVHGGYPARVVTSQGFQIHCDSVVMATNIPVNNRVTLITKNAAYRSYVIGLRAPKGSFTPNLLWDTAEPYHYVRLVQDPNSVEDILLVGGEDHRTGQDTHPDVHYLKLREWAQNRLHIEDPKIVIKWSGQIIEPMDGLAFIGHNPGDSENVYVITGDSGHGLTHAQIAANIITDLMLDRDNDFAELYSPSRINWKGLNTYIKEAAQSTAPYTDWISPGDVSSIDEIKSGEGAVLREGLSKVAVYKDASGNAHRMSAVCPHLGGIVRWNEAEKTWDCPCHGSRFDKTGEVLNGPAIHGLNEERDPYAEDELPASV